MQRYDPNWALLHLKGWKFRLTPQQYKTLRGQILAGDPDGAIKGLKRLLADKNIKRS